MSEETRDKQMLRLSMSALLQTLAYIIFGAI